MTRELIQLKINELLESGFRGQDLLGEIEGWIEASSLSANEKVRIMSDLNSYEGLEWVKIS